MSVTQHHAAASASVPCFVLTISDTRTRENDVSGRVIVALLNERGHPIVGQDLVPDDPVAIKAIVARVIAEGRARAVIATGGTGVARRDTTTETLGELFEKDLPGFGEVFRRLSFDDVGSAAILSRATAGVAGQCVIFALPGSESAVRLAMTRLILPELGHIVSELTK